MTRPGVGPLTALAFVLIIGRAERFQCGKQLGWNFVARDAVSCPKYSKHLR
jgi:hypothetical protein